MNLHLFTDSFFVDQIIQKCEKYGHNNCYVVFAGSLKFVKSKRIQRFKNYQQLKASRFPFSSISRVYIHYLGGHAVDFILDNKEITPYYWFFWGGDGYMLNSMKKGIVLPKTQYIANKSKHMLTSIRWRLISRVKQFSARKEKALHYIDYCCTWVEEDYWLFKQLGYDNLRLHFFSYLSAAELFDSLPPKVCNHNELKILAGNSLNTTNNHIEMIDFISQIFSNKTKVIFPVSYSGRQAYKEEIKKYNAAIGLNAEYLESFLPIESYLRIINDCDIIIFFHIRQQAANNSLSMLWLGKLLIMHSKSTLFRTLKTWGLSVVSLEEIDSFSDIRRLNDKFGDRLEVNRSILLKIFNEPAVGKMYKELFS